MAGLTDTGLTIKDLETLLGEMVADQIANIAADLNTEADSVVGQLNAIYAAALLALWELLEDIYQGAYPDTASGQQLSYISAITGTIREPATKATLLVHLEGTVSTTVPAGTAGYVDGDPTSLFVTTADAVIAEEGATDYIEVTMLADVAGTETKAFSTDVSLVISTPVAGLDAITIQADYTPGTDEEDDDTLRARREAEVARPGSATVEALRADLLEITGVDSCTVFENATGVADAFGLPPHSVEVLVHSSVAPAYTAQDIVNAIWVGKPAGTETFGGLSGSTDATADSDFPHTVNYSEPLEVPIYIDFTMTYDTEVYASSALAKTAVSDTLVAWALAELELGQDVYASDVIAISAAVLGITSIDPATVYVDLDGTPTTTSAVISSRQLATVDSGNITITTT